jgi:endonuclease/exonuclease/phosphatase family metal-dependent hydrolase
LLPAAPGHGDGDVKVMTYNLNNGSDLIPLLSATTPQAISGAVSEVLAEVQASDIPDRALDLAHVIAAAHPDLVGVQEASVWTVNGVVRYDVLGSVMAALARDGQHYAVVAKANAFGGQLPDAQGDIVGLQDQNAILARTDLPAQRFQISNPQSGFFAAHLDLPLPGLPQPVPALDSWVSVDVTMRGHPFRFLDTHLDSNSPLVNDAQARELVANVTHSPLPVIVAGDFNADASGAGSPTYSDLIHGGFGDAWSQVHPGQPGFTWGQADAASPGLQLNQRIDMVLYYGHFKVDHSRLVGNHKDKVTGLFPSDHLGVVATLDLP